ncbi:MAG: hypothetical protein KGQ42_09105, partial [Alphaproteobacteria bacterium]|nr:hypothetical protein [Alphaproteobacteria bacterium]
MLVILSIYVVSSLALILSGPTAEGRAFASNRLSNSQPQPAPQATPNHIREIVRERAPAIYLKPKLDFPVAQDGFHLRVAFEALGKAVHLVG